MWSNTARQASPFFYMFACLGFFVCFIVCVVFFLSLFKSLEVESGF